MADQSHRLTPEQAEASLRTVEAMKLAAWRRAVPPRWVGIGYAIITGGFCATFALERLEYKYVSYIGFWALAYLLLSVVAAKHTDAYEREYHPPESRRLSYWSSTIGMLIVGVGSIYLRYELNAPWIAVAGGMINALWLIFYYEVERRHDALAPHTETHA